MDHTFLIEVNPMSALSPTLRVVVLEGVTHGQIL